MDTWLLLTAYRKSPPTYLCWYHGRPLTTYRLPTILHDWHCI